MERCLTDPLEAVRLEARAAIESIKARA